MVWCLSHILSNKKIFTSHCKQKYFPGQYLVEFTAVFKVAESVSSHVRPVRVGLPWHLNAAAEPSSPHPSFEPNFGSTFSQTINGHTAFPPHHEMKPETKPGIETAHRITLLLFDEMRLLRECLAHLLRDSCPDIDILCYDRWARNADYSGPGPTLILFNLRQISVERFFTDHIAQDLAQAFHDTPILALSDHEDSAEALLALKSGLAGVFPATSSSNLLIAVIRLIIAGGRFVPHDILPVVNSRWETMKQFHL